MLIALVAMVASAETYNYLKFTKTDNSTVTYSVEGLKLTYDNTNVTITNVDGTATLALAQLQNMEFTNDPGSTPSVTKGDVNGDGFVNITDVLLLINYILGNDVEIIFNNANVNGDTDVNITDVTMIINYLSNNIW
jgi:hypothetical protein